MKSNMISELGLSPKMWLLVHLGDRHDRFNVLVNLFTCILPHVRGVYWILALNKHLLHLMFQLTHIRLAAHEGGVSKSHIGQILTMIPLSISFAIFYPLLMNFRWNQIKIISGTRDLSKLILELIEDDSKKMSVFFMSSVCTFYQLGLKR